MFWYNTFNYVTTLSKKLKPLERLHVFWTKRAKIFGTYMQYDTAYFRWICNLCVVLFIAICCVLPNRVCSMYLEKEELLHFLIVHFPWSSKCSLPVDAPLKAVLFDIDGTLCDSDPIHYYAFREMLQEVVLPSPSAMIILNYEYSFSLR